MFFDELTITHVQSPIIQENHYYPFGLTMQGIGKQGSNPFKYNGKEEQDELGLGWMDYGARMYDASLGRFFTQDRFAAKYYSLAPYQYAADNPIKYIDVNGDSIFISYRGNNILYQNGQLLNKDGSQYTGRGVRKDGSLKGFLGKTVSAVGELSGSSATGFGVVQNLQNSDNSFVIKKSSSNSFAADDTRTAAANLGELSSALSGVAKMGSSGTISFNPNSKLGGVDVNGSRSRPSFVGLVHEFFHASDANFGILNPS